ncbi:MAG: LysM peptidoglycan-binding domain-containing protein [Tannerella sp.]|jgi:LysM repeat protein|nr:LysM peptidoglycan-binding domain-containing protein [Tannerella sp.]
MKGITLYTLLLWIFCSIAIHTSAQTDRTASNNAGDEDIFYHTVERGQTVYSIAKMYDVKVGDIHRLNFGSDETIKAGDKLKIPQKKITGTSASRTDPDSSYIYHTIQARETLYGVSKQYEVSGKSIVEANPGLSQESFSIGKTIRIPAGKKQKQTAEIVENQKGAKEIYYTVPTRETMYNISKTFKISEKELLKLNPELSGGLRTGMTLRIPLRINEKDIPKKEEPDAREVNAMLGAKREIKLVNAAKIALLLPYNADKTTANTTLITEFYEGMLLAVDSLRNMGYATELFVHDTGDGTATLQKILKTESQTLKEVNLIIGGVSNEQIKLIADFAKTNKIKYVIPFTPRNDEVLDNAYIFQINTPQNYLYANASYVGANLFAKYNIIFLDTKDKDDQTDFINEFKRDLKERNISYKDVVYDAKNFQETITGQLSTAKPNVIMPISRSLEALTKIKTVLRMIAEKQPEYVLNLFGYPIWQTYSKDCLDDFHALDTYIYSHFYADNLNPNVKAFYDNYKNWYSKNPASNMYPKYAMLGFDIGMFFFDALQKYGANFENNLSEISYKSLQTGFNFERVNNWGGFINTNIYIIHYNKDYTITRSDFK